MTANYDTWSEEEKRQVYFSLCAEVDRLSMSIAEVRLERDGLRTRAKAAEATAERERERADAAEARLSADVVRARKEGVEVGDACIRELQARIEALEGCMRELRDALVALNDHCEYCGWGDSWERECAHAEELPEKTEKAIARATAYLHGAESPEARREGA